MAEENKDTIEIEVEQPQEEKPKRKTQNTRAAEKVERQDFSTHDGHKLTPKEARFIDLYIELGNVRQSVIKAGYDNPHPDQYGQRLLNKDYIISEINHRMELHKSASIAEADEIMQYFTSVMRGEIKDQFGLDASLGERTKAAQELAKRKIDIPQRLSGNDTPELKITLDWNRD